MKGLSDTSDMMIYCVFERGYLFQTIDFMECISFSRLCLVQGTRQNSYPILCLLCSRNDSFFLVLGTQYMIHYIDKAFPLASLRKIPGENFVVQNRP